MALQNITDANIAEDIMSGQQTAYVPEDSVFDDMPGLAFPSEDSADDYYFGLPTFQNTLSIFDIASSESFLQQLYRWSRHHIVLQNLRSSIILQGHTHEEIDARFSIVFIQIDGGSENVSPSMYLQ